MELTAAEKVNTAYFVHSIVGSQHRVGPNGYVICPNRESGEVIDAMNRYMVEKFKEEASVLCMDYPASYGLKHLSAKELLVEHAREILEAPHNIVLLYVKGFDRFYADGLHDVNEFKPTTSHYWKQHYWDQGMVELDLSSSDWQVKIQFNELVKLLQVSKKFVAFVFQIGESSNDRFDNPGVGAGRYATNSIDRSQFGVRKPLVSHALSPA